MLMFTMVLERPPFGLEPCSEPPTIIELRTDLNLVVLRGFLIDSSIGSSGIVIFERSMFNFISYYLL